MRDPAVGPPVPGSRVLGGVVPVLGVQPRDHLGHARGAAGELEHRDVVGVDGVLDLRDRPPRGLRVDVGAECVESDTSSVLVEDEDVAEGGVALSLLDGETDEVETPRAGLDQVRHRPDPSADLPDLVTAMRGERAHRYQAGLEHPVPRRDGVQPVGDLEQHRVAGDQAQPAQTGGDRVGALIELAVADATVERDDRGTVGVQPGDDVQLLGNGPVAPQPLGAVAARGVRRDTARSGRPSRSARSRSRRLPGEGDRGRRARRPDRRPDRRAAPAGPSTTTMPPTSVRIRSARSSRVSTAGRSAGPTSRNPSAPPGPCPTGALDDGVAGAVPRIGDHIGHGRECEADRGRGVRHAGSGT